MSKWWEVTINDWAKSNGLKASIENLSRTISKNMTKKELKLYWKALQEKWSIIK